MTANLTIRGIDPEVKEQSRLRAAATGRSMAEEAHRILRRGLARPDPVADSAFDWLRQPFEDFGGVDLALPTRSPGRMAPEFD